MWLVDLSVPTGTVRDMTSDAPLFKTPANPVQSSADVDSATGQSHAPYARALFEGNSGEGVASRDGGFAANTVAPVRPFAELGQQGNRSYC